MSKAQLPLLTSVMMVVQAGLAAPAGLRAKRSLKDRNAVLLTGYAAMIAADLTFAFLPTVQGMLLGAALVGVHMALTHGVTLAMIASYIPTGDVPGVGKISGTCWSFTDFIFGKRGVSGGGGGGGLIWDPSNLIGQNGWVGAHARHSGGQPPPSPGPSLHHPSLFLQASSWPTPTRWRGACRT